MNGGGGAGFLRRFADGLRHEAAALSLRGPLTGQSLAAAAAVLLSLLAALSLGIDDPYWAAISAWIVMRPSAAATLARTIMRVIGSIAGAVLGFELVTSFADTHLALHAALFLLAAVILYRQATSAHSYAWLIGGVTTLMVIFGALAEPTEAISIAFYRALEVVIGSSIGTLIAYLAFSRREIPPAAVTPASHDALLRMAVVGGTAVTLMPVIWAMFDLPGFSQLGVSVMVLLQPDPDATDWRSFNRVAGCLLGAAFGVLSIGVIEGELILWLLAIAAGIYVATYVQNGGGPINYAGTQAGIALLITMIQGAAPATQLAPALERLCGILGGIAVMTAVRLMVTPIWDAASLRRRAHP
jgi:uncharacterized membrane protein YccC